MSDADGGIRNTGSGRAMFFLLKSLVWLALVFWLMPGDAGRGLSDLARAGAAAASSASVPAGIIAEQCAADPQACLAVAGVAASAALAPPAPPPRPAKAAKTAAPQTSLKASDLAAPWKGRG